MQVILLERIESLGQMGDEVMVRPGYARNYLLPQGKALRANQTNRTYFESQRVQLEALNLQRRQEAEVVAQKMEGLSVPMVRQAGEKGQLYGSVTARDIADAIRDQGYTVQRGQVALNQPIKDLGTYPVKLALHAEVPVTVTVQVIRSMADLENLAATAAEQEAEWEAEVAEAAEMAAEAEEAEEDTANAADDPLS